MSDFKKIILDTVSDLVGEFVYYGRKEDEQLSMDQLNEAVSSGVITVQEIIDKFAEGIKNTFEKP